MTQPHSSKSTIWQKALINAVTDPKELLELLALDMNLLEAAKAASALFPLKVPRGFVARMKKGDINDPLLRQVLPLGIEQEEYTDYSKDPLQETTTNPVPGLLHKYHGRVLLTLMGTCAINCRFCFRRYFPYEKNNPGSLGWEKTIEYIKQDSTISEVILSGGDPLVANDALLQQLSEKLAAISHLKRLRIHSRIPIVLPERITSPFINWIKQLPLKCIMVVHSNHAQEINDDVRKAMQKLSTAGAVLLNQTVLLKGVNDSAETLIKLSEALFATGIQPYYLHVLDKVQGTAHFDLPRARAIQLHTEMMQHLSGFLVPKLVCEQPGEASKLLIFS